MAGPVPDLIASDIALLRGHQVTFGAALGDEGDPFPATFVVPCRGGDSVDDRCPPFFPRLGMVSKDDPIVAAAARFAVLVAAELNSSSPWWIWTREVRGRDGDRAGRVYTRYLNLKGLTILVDGTDVDGDGLVETMVILANYGAANVFQLVYGEAHPALSSTFNPRLSVRRYLP
ncbi:MAG: hypothetical protein HYV03_08265 [Deltaproteobacteria bacterium]|nr:hypothetical protein [Deltaproteobacteria bacterium]